MSLDVGSEATMTLLKALSVIFIKSNSPCSYTGNHFEICF